MGLGSTSGRRCWRFASVLDVLEPPGACLTEMSLAFSERVRRYRTIKRSQICLVWHAHPPHCALPLSRTCTMGVKLSVGLEQKSVSEGLGLLGMPEAWFAVASLVRYRKGSPKGLGVQDGGSAGVGEDGAPPPFDAYIFVRKERRTRGPDDMPQSREREQIRVGGTNEKRLCLLFFRIGTSEGSGFGSVRVGKLFEMASHELCCARPSRVGPSHGAAAPFRNSIVPLQALICLVPRCAQVA